jgi:SAM-dependent methyltransferase
MRWRGTRNSGSIFPEHSHTHPSPQTFGGWTAEMDAKSYDRWYETPRGRWIGQREAALVLQNLQPRPGESLLDVGCGTGFFTRTLAAALDGRVAGVDINPDWVAYARRRDDGEASYAVADARSLPYANASFDLVVSIAALCFIEEEITAVHEILRVAHRRFAIGLLNRHSLLYLQMGPGGGRGGYRGAHWHTVREARGLFHDLPVEHLRVHTAIQIPSGGSFARRIERAWPSSLPSGAFILVAGDVACAT